MPTPNIFFQNGNSSQKGIAIANVAVNLIEQKINRKVGLIIKNITNQNLVDELEFTSNKATRSRSKFADQANLRKHLPNTLTLTDALNGEVYQQIANNGNKKNLIIMHSAGNKDAIKSAQVLALNNVNLNNNIDFISVGSPLSNSQLKEVIEPIGGNVIGSYNNWLDPVTHSKTWAVGAGSLFIGGAIYGAAYGTTIGLNATSGIGAGMEVSTPLHAFFSYGLKLTAIAAGGAAGGAVGGAVGGAAGFGTGYYNLQIQHPFNTYFNKDFKNLKIDIKKWSDNNPISKN